MYYKAESVNPVSMVIANESQYNVQVDGRVITPSFIQRESETI